MEQTEIKSMSPALQIVAILSRIYKSGMTTTSGGNISMLDEEGNIWITPSGIDKGTLTEEDISCVRKDGTFSGKHKPSSELPFHQAIYETRPDIRAVIHAHPPALTSFSIVRKIPDTRILPQAKNFCGGVGYAPYELPGSDELGNKIAGVFEDYQIKSAVMENHAVVVGGANMEDAYKRLEYLELCSQTIINANILGQPVFLSDDELGDYAERVHTFQYDSAEIKSEGKENLIRNEIVSFVQRACSQGLISGASGDISVRTGMDSFLITPADKLRWSIGVQDIVHIQGNKSERNKKPGTFTKLYQRIYNANPDINSIIHAQPVHLMAFATTNIDLNVRTIPESWIFLQDLPKVPLTSLYPENDTIPEILKSGIAGVLISNDSVLMVGDQLIQTFDKLEIAEFSAKSILLSKSIGNIIPMDENQIEGLRKKFLS